MANSCSASASRRGGGKVEINRHESSTASSMRKIYLAHRNEPMFFRAIELLGESVISYRLSQFWIAVHADDYLLALVVLKNHGIRTETAAG